MTSADWLAIVSAILAVLGGAVGVLSYLTSARKSRVDELDAIVDNLATENRRLRDRVSELEAKLQAAHQVIAALEKYIVSLLEAMSAANVSAPKPPAEYATELSLNWRW